MVMTIVIKLLFIQMYGVYKNYRARIGTGKEQIVRKYSFSQRRPRMNERLNVWDNLFAEWVHTSCVNVFKLTIDKCIIREDYTLMSSR